MGCGPYASPHDDLFYMRNLIKERNVKSKKKTRQCEICGEFRDKQAQNWQRIEGKDYCEGCREDIRDYLDAEQIFNGYSHKLLERIAEAM